MNERTIFLNALDCATPVQRAAFLDHACAGNADLRERVEQLLRDHEQQGNSPGNFAPPPHLGDTDPESPGDGRTGDPSPQAVPQARIGPYRLIRPLGEGGMGVVYLAEQESPVRRQVALKIIKPGLDGGHILARFEAERQALALMEHPNIARVLDGGTTSTGRPFFVMELVPGIPFTQYCDQRRLSLRDRLELLIPVCRAIQHAHQKGIIHRDIKPSNVLVSDCDDRPLPKVIDFGVAKALEQRLTQQSLHTQVGTVVGTIDFMAPEQAEPGSASVDTRSDVYSLGVLLYEQLTGSTPLNRRQRPALPIGELLRLVREEETPRPSDRLAQAGDRLSVIAEERSAAPERLIKAVRAELDWVALKALDKERGRRYESPGALAQDLERFLTNAPVAACPPTLGYQLRKLASRHGKLLATMAAFVVLLLGSAISGIWLAWRAEQERALATMAQTQAEERFQREKEAVDKYFHAVLEDQQLRERPDLLPLRKKLLESALPFYEHLLQQKPGSQEEERERGRALRRLAEARAAFGEHEQAKSNYEEWQGLLSRLVAESPGDGELRSELVQSQAALGRLLSLIGDVEGERACLAQALVNSEQLVADFPARNDYRRNLAGLLRNRGLQLEADNLTDAKAAYHRAVILMAPLVEEGNRDPGISQEFADSLWSLGNLQLRLGDVPAAQATLERAVAVVEPLLANVSPSTPLSIVVPRLYFSLSELKEGLGQGAEARTLSQRGLAAHEKLVSQNPYRLPLREELITRYTNVSFRSDNSPEEQALARKALERALELADHLAVMVPSNSTYRGHQFVCLMNLSNLLRGMKDYPAARTALERARLLTKTNTQEEPLEGANEQRAHINLNLGSLLEEMEDWAGAQRTLESALADLEKAGVATSPNPALRQLPATCLLQLGRLSLRKGDLPGARKAQERALRLLEKIAADFPGRHDLRFTYVQALIQTENRQGALAEIDRLLAEPKPLPMTVVECACALAVLSHAGYSSRDTTEKAMAERHAGRAVALLRQLAGQYPEHIEDLTRLLNERRELETLRDRTDYKELVAMLQAPKKHGARDTARP